MTNEDDSRDSIDKFLDLAPVVVERPAPPAILESTEPVSHVQEDYEYARDTLRDLVSEGMQLFKESAEAAKAGGQPEQFQVAATVLKTVVDAGDKLLGLSEKHQKVVGTTKDIKTVNNNLTVKMNSNDFLDMILEAKKAKQHGTEA